MGSAPGRIRQGPSLHSPHMPRYADVAVQLPVPGTYSYKVPERLADRLLIGARVLVPFGNRGVTGVVVGELDAPPAGVTRMRELYALLDPQPMVVPPVLELCRWIAGYYESPPGEALRAALPPGTSITADQQVSLQTQGGPRLRAREARCLGSSSASLGCWPPQTNPFRSEC